MLSIAARLSALRGMIKSFFVSTTGTDKCQLLLTNAFVHFIEPWKWEIIERVSSVEKFEAGLLWVMWEKRRKTAANFWQNLANFEVENLFNFSL